KVVCATNAQACVAAGLIAQEALDWAESIAPPGVVPHNNIYDAYRHAYWSAAMMQAFGDPYATLWGNAHEWLPADQITQQSTLESCQDLHNNAVGRYIGANNLFVSKEALKQLVIDSGSLQPDLTC